jgi:hypothetical protein
VSPWSWSRLFHPPIGADRKKNYNFFLSQVEKEKTYSFFFLAVPSCRRYAIASISTEWGRFHRVSLSRIIR